MDSISEIKESTSFIQHMTRFDEGSKSNLMNLIQYSLLCLIPIVVFKKFVSPLFPEVEETKGSLEISVEVLLQVCTIFVGLFLIQRLVTFVEPYSGKNYPEMNLIHISLALLFIIMTFETKIAEKVDILVERLHVLWNGEGSSDADEKKDHKERVHVKQPIATTQPAPTHQNSRADYLTSHEMMREPQQHVQNMSTSIDALPTYGGQPQQSSSHVPQMQQQPSFDQMYTEPMAANDSLGGFGSPW